MGLLMFNIPQYEGRKVGQMYLRGKCDLPAGSEPCQIPCFVCKITWANFIHSSFYACPHSPKTNESSVHLNNIWSYTEGGEKAMLALVWLCRRDKLFHLD